MPQLHPHYCGSRTDIETWKSFFAFRFLYNNKVDHFKVKLRLPSVYHVGFSIKGEDEVDGEVDGEVDSEVDGEVDCEVYGDVDDEVDCKDGPLPTHTNPSLINPYQPSPTRTNSNQPLQTHANP